MQVQAAVPMISASAIMEMLAAEVKRAKACLAEDGEYELAGNGYNSAEAYGILKAIYKMAKEADD